MKFVPLLIAAGLTMSAPSPTQQTAAAPVSLTAPAMKALQMQVMRHDPHMTVMTTGHTSLFLFDTGPGIPMSDGQPSRWHHIGFVVDSLDHAYHHLRQFADLSTDFTLLERQERWSLYGYYRNGDVEFMIQLSEIRDGWRGFDDPAAITDALYDYSGQRYGKRLEEG